MSDTLMARRLEPALHDLFDACRARERGEYDTSPLFEATVRVGGDQENLFARVSLHRPRAGEPATVYVYAWATSTDFARFVAGRPPAPIDEEPLLLRGPVRENFADFSRRVALELCQQVGGHDLGEDQGVAFFRCSVPDA